MSYIIKAVLSNPRCPGSGLVTVPFPIPDQECDQTMELLSGLKIGDALEQDCRVDELDILVWSSGYLERDGGQGG